MFLHTLETVDVFQQAIPKLPMGKYAHIITLRETNSFALFQTDGELNISRVKDPTEAEFVYVLNNILRTRRYGAQNTRTGTVENIITGIVFADGEIFSNLELTQAVYDHLPAEQRAKTPLLRDAVRGAMEAIVPELLSEDGVVFHAFAGERLETILRETLQVTSDEARLREVLIQANAEANRYAIDHGVGPVKEAKARK